MLVSFSLMTLTEVLENYFLLPLMQEAWCRSWRLCVQTLPLHTRPLPPSGGAFGALLCRKEFLLNCSSHSPQIIEWPWGPDPAGPGAASAAFHGDGRARSRAGSGPEEQRLLQTPDLAVLLISYLLKNAPTVGVCVCLFPFCGSFSSKLPFISLAKSELTYWNWETPTFSCFLKELH